MPDKFLGSPVLSMDLKEDIFFSAAWTTEGSCSLWTLPRLRKTPRQSLRLEPPEAMIKARVAFSAVAWKTLRVSHSAHRLLLIGPSKRQKAEEYWDPDLVEVWKTPLAYPQAYAIGAVDELRAAFPTPRRRKPRKRGLGSEGGSIFELGD